MQRGRKLDAANAIADYEQRIVVQPVYERYADTFRGMSRADRVDVFNDRTSIPIAKTCTRDNLVTLDGDISNPAHRVDYYRKLIRNMYRVKGRR